MQCTLSPKPATWTYTVASCRNDERPAHRRACCKDVRGQCGAQLVILGLSTTAVYHTMILDLPDFKSGDIDTGFIPKHAEELQDPPPPIRVRMFSA